MLKLLLVAILVNKNINANICSLKTSYLEKKKPVNFYQNQNNTIPINNNYIKENITYNSSNKKPQNLEKFEPYPLNYKFFK